MRTRHEELLEAYIEELGREFPGFAIVPKAESRLHRAIDRVLRVVTLGKMTSYLDGYQTTIGRTIYVTSHWSRIQAGQRYATLRHEAVHLRQFRRWTLPGMALLYIFVPLPLGLAYFRMRFEREAYEESIRTDAALWGRAHVEALGYRRRIVEQFTGASYGWMWPFRRGLERWYDRVLESL